MVFPFFTFANLIVLYRFVRVDLSFANEKIYFGELTFYPLGGIYKFKPISLDHKLGEFLKIPDL